MTTERFIRPHPRPRNTPAGAQLTPIDRKADTMDHDVLTDPICDWHFEGHGRGSSTTTILVTLYGAEGTRATLRFTDPDIAG